MNIPQFTSAVPFQKTQNLPRPQFGVIPDEVKTVIEKTKASPEASDEYLFTVIKSNLHYLTRILNELKNNYSDLNFQLMINRVDRLIGHIEQIKTQDLLDKVIQHFDEKSDYKAGKFGVSYKDVMSALVQKSSELNNPYRIPGLGD